MEYSPLPILSSTSMSVISTARCSSWNKLLSRITSHPSHLRASPLVSLFDMDLRVIGLLNLVEPWRKREPALRVCSTSAIIVIPWRKREPVPSEGALFAMSSVRLPFSSRLHQIEETYYWWATIHHALYLPLLCPLTATFLRANNDSGSPIGEWSQSYKQGSHRSDGSMQVYGF